MSQPFVFPRSRPEAVGVSSSYISAFLKAADSTRIGLHSFMLLRHGQVAAEAWWGPYESGLPHNLYSLSKSFTSTAIGLAVEEGRLSADDFVLSFFPERDARSDANLRAMRVKHLLSMSTGHTQHTVGQLWKLREQDWVQHFLDMPVEREPGTHFVYNGAASYMLSAIVQKVTGMTLLDFLTPRLLEPLGIRGAAWESCPRGINAGNTGLALKTEDIARFGQLYLQKGRWNGAQLLSEAWVNEATSVQIETVRKKPDYNQGYGYQFWGCRHGAYRGDGAHGQFCIVMPDQDAVIAITAGVKDTHEVLDLVWDHLLPGMQDQPLPVHDEQYDDLRNVIDSLAYTPLSSDLLSPAAERISGIRYLFPENELKLHAASIRFEGDKCSVMFREQQREHRVHCGIGYWMKGMIELTGQPMTIAASGMWRDADTFEMECRFLETPYAITLTCHFAEDRVNLQIAIDPEMKSRGTDEPFIVQGKQE